MDGSVDPHFEVPAATMTLTLFSTTTKATTTLLTANVGLWLVFLALVTAQPYETLPMRST